MPGKIRQYFRDKKDDVQDYTGGSGVIGKLVVALLVVYLLIAMVLGIYWSSEPDTFSVRDHTRTLASTMDREPVTGFATTATMIRIAETLLDKPGGYISNDIAPPGLWMDNMPNWEYGVLVQLRDLSREVPEQGDKRSQVFLPVLFYAIAGQDQQVNIGMRVQLAPAIPPHGHQCNVCGAGERVSVPDQPEYLVDGVGPGKNQGADIGALLKCLGISVITFPQEFACGKHR